MCSLVTLNTRGVPLFGSRLAQRYAAIGSALEGGDAEVVCFQEVLTWWHLRLLARRMRSFRHVSLRPSPPGPAGGLVTFSRLPVSGTSYRGFGVPRSSAVPTHPCIDFILTGDGVKAEAATIVFAGKEQLPGGPGGRGYVSDHLGLSATLARGHV